MLNVILVVDVGFRDPCGIRPLCFGIQLDESGAPTGYALASGSVAIGIIPEQLDSVFYQACIDLQRTIADAISLMFKFVRDVAPGEAVFVSNSCEVFTQMCHTNCTLSPCIFEYVYFARPDSVMDG